MANVQQTDSGNPPDTESDYVSSASELDESEEEITQKTAECTLCKEIKEDDSEEHGNVGTLHIDARIMSVSGNKANNKRRARDRETYTNLILKYICAIRNSGKGILYLHVKNQPTDNLYTGWLDEQLDPELNRLIEDGALFDNIYKKFWVKPHKQNCHRGFLAVKICPSNIVSTVRYNTFFQTDQGVEQMQSNNILMFFKKKTEFGNTSPKLKGEPNRNVFESRHIQFKHFEKTNETTADYLMKKIWDTKHQQDKPPFLITPNGSNIRKYISAFTKQEDGGSYYFGIRENKTTNPPENECSGFRFRNEGNRSAITIDKFKTDLEQKLKTLLAFDYEGQPIPPKFFEVNITQATTHGNHWILEVAVAAVSGIVFTSRPESYFFLNGRPKRYGESYWIKRMVKKVQ